MNTVLILAPSTRKHKKWMIQFPDGHTVHFGNSLYDDFLMHHNNERRRNYLARSKPLGDDPRKANWWARNLLWSRPTMSEAIKYCESLLNMKIIKKRSN